MKISLACCLLLMGVSTMASRILYLLPAGPKSHFRFSNAVVDALASAGHQITFLTTDPSGKQRENVTEIITHINPTAEAFSNPFTLTFAGMVHQALYHIPDACALTRGHPSAVEALAGDYDVAYLGAYFAECFLPAIYEKQIPYIFVSPNTPTPYQAKAMGNPEFSSISPPRNFEFHHPMTFFQRMSSAVSVFVQDLMMESIYLPIMERACKQSGSCPGTGPSILEIYRNASLMVINSVKTIDQPMKPVVSTLVYAGGIHIVSGQSLAKEFTDWIDGCDEEGFIIFSLGSMANTADTHEDNLRALLNVFGTLKQRVIMKWDSPFSLDVPANVMISKWLPQQQLLEHPKIRLFVTHGGLLSTLEAAYFGIPIVGMPIFADQFNNLANSVHEGWASYVSWNNLEETVLLEKVQNALSDPIYKENVMKKSIIMRDSQHTPQEDVVYWTEYVIRHKGAPHLESVFRHMTWYQIYNVDVWLIVIFGSFFMFCLNCLILYKIVSLCCRSKRKQD